jgi:hypothetical protein
MIGGRWGKQYGVAIILPPEATADKQQPFIR